MRRNLNGYVKPNYLSYRHKTRLTKFSLIIKICSAPVSFEGGTLPPHSSRVPHSILSFVTLFVDCHMVSPCHCGSVFLGFQIYHNPDENKLVTKDE